jgi:hypothetical protein
MVFRRFRELRIFRQLRLKAPLGDAGTLGGGEGCGTGESQETRSLGRGQDVDRSLHTKEGSERAPL